ncbi:hypothetical protein FOA52_004420 [Chlamydomonas sp. UWO 241]|nr:hypothetical protein FOA52_004420 [Chlamydomonas sp. UWO 241]
MHAAAALSLHPFNQNLLLIEDDEQTGRALRQAARVGDVGAMSLVLLDHPYAEAAAELMAVDNHRWTALMWAASYGHMDAMRLLLNHSAANAAALLMSADNHGCTALTLAASNGHVDAVRLLLDHPRAAATAMLAHAGPGGFTSLMVAALRVSAADPRAVRARMLRDAVLALSGFGYQVAVVSPPSCWLLSTATSMQCGCCSTTRAPTQRP